MKKINVLCLSLAGLMVYGNITHARESSYPFIAGDTFRAIANHIIDETNQPFNPSVVKAYDIVFLKTDYAMRFFTQYHDFIPNPYILITHNSDMSPIFLTAYDHPSQGISFESYLNDEKLVAWFAQNIDLIHPKLHPLPIGVANSYNNHGKVELFAHATQHIPSLENRSSQIYLNFTITNNPAERQPVMDYFSGKSFAYFAKPKPPAQYLEEMKQYRYVINPPGNGLDCHRTWEALLLGCIPIMKHSILDTMLADLPIIFVNEWSEVTPEFLETHYQEMKHRTYNLKKAYADYWIDRIHSYAAPS